MIDKTLKALAEAATQGEWFIHERYTHAIFSADFHVANAFEERDLAYIVAAHPAAILALLDQHAAESAELEAQVYAPGLWRCAKCDFKLIQSNLNARDGSVTAREMPGNICPNCRVPLWRITERQLHHTLMSDNERLFYEKRLAESSLAEENAKVERLRLAGEHLLTQMNDLLCYRKDQPNLGMLIGDSERLGEAMRGLRAALAGTDTPEKTGA